MKIYRVMRGECKCGMACNSYKINDVEKKCFWGDTEGYTLKKNILDHINEIPPKAMPYYFPHYL